MCHSARHSSKADTKNMTQDPHSKKVWKTGSSKNRKQHTIRCKSIHISVDSGQLRIYHTAGVHRELHDRFIASCNSKPPSLTKAFVCTIREIEHHDVVSSGILANEFCDEPPWAWTYQALKNLTEATKLYLVEVIPGYHFRSSN
jgi:hypothetical protein